MTTYFEDVEVGEEREFGSYDVTAEEIVEFAEKYDPQPFHVDPEAAEESIYGGLIASGWHTASMCMRMLVDGFFSDLAAVGSPGVDELRWRAPVRPGDTLSVRTEVAKKEATRPESGMVDIDTAVSNEEETVMTMSARVIVARRD